MRLFAKKQANVEPVLTRAGVAAMRKEVLAHQHEMSYHMLMGRLAALRRLDEQLDAGAAQAGHEVALTLERTIPNG